MALPETLRRRLTLPAMVAPMFLVSGTRLVIESCKAGLIGTLTRNHCRTDDEFESQLVSVRDALLRAQHDEPHRLIGPLAANVSIRMQPDARCAALDACRRHEVAVVVTAGGDPAPVVAEVHRWGGLLFHDVTSLRFARKAIDAGVDGLIAIGAGGGGHSGTISHLALVPEIRAMFQGVIVMAGAIAKGAAIRAAEVLGADLAYLGTRFIATQESMAPDDYKAMLVRETSADLLYSDAINGTPAMWMKASMRQVGLDPDNLPRPTGRKSEHLPPHVKPWKNLWSAGHGIGLTDDIPTVAELVLRLREEYQSACATPSWPRQLETDDE